tara:strand:- start:230 stop:751 length:522 start_codon:yes stop_codon:yes gene_type:complete
MFAKPSKSLRKKKMALKGLLKAVAPTLLSTVEKSSPIAAVAVRLAAKKLNLPDNSTPEQIENELEKRPDATEILESVELQIKQMEANLESQRLGNEDRADAREKFAGDWFVKVFSLALFVFFAFYVWEITHQPESEQNMALVNLTLGNLFGLVQAVVAYYFSGSMDNGNQKKR